MGVVAGTALIADTGSAPMAEGRTVTSGDRGPGAAD